MKFNFRKRQEALQRAAECKPGQHDLQEFGFQVNTIKAKERNTYQCTKCGKVVYGIWRKIKK